MEYRQLGKSGLLLSTIGLGTNRFGSESVPQDQVDDIIAAALDVGINFIDSADVYTDGESERTLGQALKGRWDRVVLATKFFFPTGEGSNDKGASRYHMLNAVEASLRRLNTDHIDLYYVHRWDVNTPIEETLRALDDLITQGKVRYIGASNFAAWQLAHANLLAEMRSWTAFTAMQSHYHMLERGVETEIIPYCQAHQVGFIPYFPLAGGFLTGKYQRGVDIPAGSRGEFSQYVQGYLTDKNFDLIEKLTAWCATQNRRLFELAEAWLLAQSGVTSVISGATKVDQVLKNAKAAGWDLRGQQLEDVNAILESSQ